MHEALLIVALILALGFEFINGFHDTANAVATVIYTKALKPWQAVIWSGGWNFVGALTSSGAVAYSIITLLPPDLMNSHSIDGTAVIFSFLISAIVWSLGTWWFGLPVSTSHTLVSAIFGVGLAATALLPAEAGSGVSWHSVKLVFLSLLISPVIGFSVSAVLMLALRWLKPHQSTPNADPAAAPPWRKRAVLIFTSMGISFAHGSNDGQKGMGIIMLILFGLMPNDYKLDPATHAIPFWVKALSGAVIGLGTMIGWKRIAVTIGEKIGRQHMTYRQGAVAEFVAALTIFGADRLGLPVSSTHVLTSDVAGTMVASGSGVQRATVRNIVLAWVLTSPVAILLGAGVLGATLYCLTQI